MKRTKAAMLCLMLVLTMSGCASQDGNTEPAQTEAAQVSSENTADTDKEENQDDDTGKDTEKNDFLEHIE